MPDTTTPTIDPTKALADLEAMGKFIADQTTAAWKQGEDLLAVAKKQTISNIQQAQELALEGIDKVRGLATENLPAAPAWMIAPSIGSTVLATGFDLIEQMLAAERKVATMLLSQFTPAS